MNLTTQRVSHYTPGREFRNKVTENIVGNIFKKTMINSREKQRAVKERKSNHSTLYDSAVTALE